MRKKRRISMWLLPIIAIIGAIGYLTNDHEELKRRKTVKKQPRDINKKVPVNYELEMGRITPSDELEIEQSKKL